MTDKIPRDKNKFSKPLYFFVITIVLIFIIETFIMFYLSSLEHASPYYHIFLDSTILSLATMLMLYFLLFRPMTQYVKERDAAENELMASHEILELKIGERTKELIMEIEERKRIEEALQKSEFNLMRAQEVAHIGSWYLDLIENNLIWTDESYRIFGIPKGTPMTYEKFLEIIHPEDRDYVDRKWKAAIKRGPYDIEHRLLIGNEVKWVREKAELNFDKDGKPVNGIGIVQDITEKKKMAEELLNIEKLESLGVLAGGIAHDFNNLLTGIIGNLSLLKQQIDKEEETYKYLVEIEKASFNTQNLTKQLLTFSKGGEPIKETTYLGKLLEESSCFVLRGSGVRCNYSISEDLWPANVDKGQITQVINNMIINARQAMPGGGILKIVADNYTITKEDNLPFNEGKYLRIIIEDQGQGIPDNIKSKIFDPFFTTKQNGSGLGLATSYSIVKKHGGYITVSSEIGVGTTFTVYLPATDRNAVIKKERRTLLPASMSGRILIMDDEELIRKVATAMLTSVGYEVRTASEGNEAINLYKEANKAGRPYDAVIMDLTIPGGMGGNEATRIILKFDPDAKVIVSSGYSNDPVIADYKKHGFSEVVTKPYKVEELTSKVFQVITGSTQYLIPLFNS